MRFRLLFFQSFPKESSKSATANVPVEAMSVVLVYEHLIAAINIGLMWGNMWGSSKVLPNNRANAAS